MMRVAGTSLAGLAFTAIALACCGSLAAQADPAKPACAERKGVLGVSRVIEVDTTSGPRLGNMQYKDIDFLEPGEIVLTFDDGPLRPKTTAVLNALEAHCTKATFFMVGRMVLFDPDMVREIDKRGHTVGTHTWSHKMLGRLSRARAEKEIELGISAVSLALGKPAAPFFRFPYLSDPQTMQAYLKERGIGIFSIDIDSLDFRTGSGRSVINRTLTGLKRLGKGVLLFHDIQRSTAKGIAGLLDELARQGYKVVHLVPKKPLTTVKKYDEMAKKEALRRKRVADNRPLAARSIVWPVSSANEFPTAEPLKITPPGLFKGPLPERSGLTRPPIATQPEEPEEVTDRRAPAPRPKKRHGGSAKLETPPGQDWRLEVFNP